MPAPGSIYYTQVLAMNAKKPKSLRRIEERMAELAPDTLRYRVLESAKAFKTSWVDLGKALYPVWKDRQYRGWGYQTFQAYVGQELGIRNQTALKLVNSYAFLAREGEAFLRDDYLASARAASLPSLDAIDLLRRAQCRRDLDSAALTSLRQEVLEFGKEAGEVRRDLTALIRRREESEPEEARGKKRFAAVRRLLGALKAFRREAALLKLLPDTLLAEAERLIEKIEAELGRKPLG